MPGRRVPKKPKTRNRNGFPSVVQRADGRWSVTVSLGVDPQGRRRRFQTTCATQEEALEAGIRAQLQRGKLRSDQGRGLTVSGLLDHFIASRPATEFSTRQNRAWERELITRHVGNVPLARVDVATVTHLVAGLTAERKAPSTVAKCRRLLGSAFKYAMAHGFMDRNPVLASSPPAVPSRMREEAWTRQEVARIVTAADDTRLHALFLMLLTTGARVGELIGARIEDYDPRTGVLHIEGTAKAGGGRGKAKTAAAHRTCHVPKSVQRVMSSHLEEVARARLAAGALWGQRQETAEVTRRKQSAASRQRAAHPLPVGWRPRTPPATPYEPLFPTGNGTPWLASNVAKVWKEVLVSAGLPHRRLHSTRAAFITSALRNPSVHSGDVQTAVGHTSAAMTARYVQAVRGAQARVASAAVAGLGLNVLPEHD